MSGVYSMSAPTYSGLTKLDLLDSAMSQPLSLTSTLYEEGKGGAMESFGLGTVLRGSQVPLPAPSEDAPYGFDPSGLDVPAGISPQDYLQGAWVTPDMIAKKRQEMGALTEDQYKASPAYRKDIPYDPGMTETRAAALASMDDAKKVREFYAQKRPLAAFLGSMAGQALDPINYIPVGGPLVKAAAIGRFGRIGGEALTAGLDAAANTAVFGIGTAGARAEFGDDVSWQSLVSQIATAGLIGGAFGTIHGAIGSRIDARRMAEAEQRLSTLQTTQEARIALNEGIDAVSRGEDVNLSPNSTEPMARVAGDIGDYTPASTVVGEPPQKGLVVANRYADGKTYIGQPGDLHFSVHDRYPHELRGDPVSEGFMTPDGQFLDRKQALDWVAQNEKPVRASDNMAGELDALDYRQQVPESQKAGPRLSPVEAYHGTLADFEKFDPKFLGSETDVGSAREAFFFSSDARVSEGYATSGNPYKDGVTGKLLPGKLGEFYQKLNEALLKFLRGKGLIEEGQILRTRLRMDNPKIIDRMGKEVVDSELLDAIKTAKAEGHDAVIFKNSRDPGYTDASDISSDVYAVFDPSKIDILSKHKDAASAAAARGQAPASGPPVRSAVDTTKARPDPIPEGRKQAETAIAKPDDTKALAAQYRVDPQTGAFPEEADVAQLAVEGRLTEEDAANLAQAHVDFETADGYAEALKSVAGCLV